MNKAKSVIKTQGGRIFINEHVENIWLAIRGKRLPDM